MILITLWLRKKRYIPLSAMREFTIRDIENLSGIKAHTWRIWEQRYGISVSERKESKHRFYNNEHLKHILQIAYLYNSGLKISRICGLQPEEMSRIAIQKDTANNVNNYFVKELIEAAIDLNELRFATTFDEIIEQLGIEKAFLQLIKSFQERIGLLWLTNHLIPAQEHVTSNIIRQKLATAIDKLPRVTGEQTNEIALFTPERELHEIPLQLAHYLLKKNGKKVIYFGSNVKIEALKAYDKEHTCRRFFFCLMTNLTNLSPDEYLQQICETFAGAEVIMSGSQTAQISQIPHNATLLGTSEMIMEFVQQ